MEDKSIGGLGFNDLANIAYLSRDDSTMVPYGTVQECMPGW